MKKGSYTMKELYDNLYYKPFDSLKQAQSGAYTPFAFNYRFEDGSEVVPCDGA